MKCNTFCLSVFGVMSQYFRYCGVKNPSWREIKHFVHFFNNQLLDCENSVFCNPLHVGDSLPGFKSFVVKFMLQMSKVVFFINCYFIFKTN